MADADRVTIPEALWLDLVEGFLPYLESDKRLADAWVAIGDYLQHSDGSACGQ